jgi:hypothetical protein
MLLFMTFAVIGVVGYAFWREGVLTALSITVNIFLAGLVAFNFWEPLAAGLEDMLAGTVAAGLEDAIALFLLFSLTLGGLRAVTNNLANRQLEYHPVLQQVGSVVCALVAGYLLAGFLVCMLQTLPLSEKFLGFDPYIEAGSQGMRRVLPPDRVWLAMMARASQGPFAWSEVTPFDPDGSFELRYAKARRFKEQ